MHGALSAFENENKKESLNRGSTWGQAPNCDRGPVCGPVLIAPVIQNIIWGRNIFFFCRLQENIPVTPYLGKGFASSLPAVSWWSPGCGGRRGGPRDRAFHRLGIYTCIVVVTRSHLELDGASRRLPLRLRPSFAGALVDRTAGRRFAAWGFQKGFRQDVVFYDSHRNKKGINGSRSITVPGLSCT